METAMDRYTVEERLDDFHDILRSDCRFGIADGWSSQLQLDPTGEQWLVDELLKQMNEQQQHQQSELPPDDVSLLDETVIDLTALLPPCSTDSVSSDEQQSPVETVHGELWSTVITPPHSPPKQRELRSTQRRSESMTDAARRRRLKRDANNAASRKSRAKKNEKFTMLEREVSELQKENDELKQKLQRTYRLLSRNSVERATLMFDEYPMEQFLPLDCIM